MGLFIGHPAMGILLLTAVWSNGFLLGRLIGQQDPRKSDLALSKSAESAPDMGTKPLSPRQA